MNKSSEPLFSFALLPLWCGLLLIAVVPFLSIWRVGPLNSFFLESGSLLFCLLMAGYTAFSGSLCRVRIPAASWYFVVLALFWAVQARVMGLVYPGLSDMAAWAFVVSALTVWACRAWMCRFGSERVLTVLAAVLLSGCVLQATVAWMQYTGVAASFKGLLMYRAGSVEGQLGQRNHLGHYLMWGVLSAAWMWERKRLPAWVVLPVVLYVSLAIALTGSRTVLAYLLVLAVLLPAYRWFSGSRSTRLVCCLAAVCVCVSVCQLAAEPLLSLFEGRLTTALERLDSVPFNESGRYYEWRKAWQIFLSAPLWGYGWNSYALQGFLSDIYPNGFRPYESSVLFTHSHNALLNLLAEMGLAGTALAAGGLACVVTGSLKRCRTPGGLFVLALLSVSLVHSLLEYPLWYVYFLSVFALLVGFLPDGGEADAQPVYRPVWRYGVMVAVAVLAAGIVRLGFAYQQLCGFAGKVPEQEAAKAENIAGLLAVAKTEPMLKYYAQQQLVAYIDPKADNLPDWAAEVTRETSQFRPYANAYKYALTEYRAGRYEAAEQWMQKMYRYYPAKLPAYGSALADNPRYSRLQHGYKVACMQYAAVSGSQTGCIGYLDE